MSAVRKIPQSIRSEIAQTADMVHAFSVNNPEKATGFIEKALMREWARGVRIGLTHKAQSKGAIEPSPLSAEAQSAHKTAQARPRNADLPLDAFRTVRIGGPQRSGFRFLRASSFNLQPLRGVADGDTDAKSNAEDATADKVLTIFGQAAYGAEGKLDHSDDLYWCPEHTADGYIWHVRHRTGKDVIASQTVTSPELKVCVERGLFEAASLSASDGTVLEDEVYLSTYSTKMAFLAFLAHRKADIQCPDDDMNSASDYV